jgi:O-antigen ligase
MQLSKNKKYQYTFFLLILNYSIFNGGNSNLLIQVNFLLISFFYIFCLIDKNYNQHFKYFVKENKKPIFFYVLFLFYLLFQILPLPVDLLKFFSPEKYKHLISINSVFEFSSISLAPSNSFFQFLNFCSLLILVFILKMIFYREKHKNRLYLFLSFIGFLSALIATFLYLSGNADILSFKSFNNKSASTGFFINRTVFSIFLLFCLISSLEYLGNSKNLKDKMITCIYVRLFIVFITIGLIITFSRIGNFLLLNTMLIYMINEIFFKKEKKNILRNIILTIIIVDVFVLGIYFGSSRVIDRFSFLQNEFAQISNTDVNFLRFQVIKFAINQIYHYLFFGYGPGSFEILFQLKFPNLSNQYANHAHSDLFQFIGEFGLIGFLLFFLSILSFFLKINYNIKNNLLIFCLVIILFFDFSLHIPFIQFLFVCFFVLNQKFTKLSSNRP